MSKDKQSIGTQQSAAPVIVPTIGRQLWFWESGAKRAEAEIDRRVQAEAATVVYVVDERCVHLQVLSLKGRARAVLNAQLKQPGDPWNQTTGPHCQWIPYQVGQAKASAEVRP